MDEQRFDVVLRVATSVIHVLLPREGSHAHRVLPVPGGALGRFGDPTPLLADPLRRAPEALVDQVLQQALPWNSGPAHVLVLVPDAWGAYRREAMDAVVRRLGGTALVLPETAFLLDAGLGQVQQGAAGVLLRLGSGETRATCVARSADGWGATRHTEAAWGGQDVDDLVVGFLLRRLPTGTEAPAATIRESSRALRELLSSSVTTDAVVSGVRVWLHRHDVEDLARPGLDRALSISLAALLSELDEPPPEVWLAGGLSRMPLVAQRASEVADRPVRVLDWQELAAARLRVPGAAHPDQTGPRRALAEATDPLQPMHGRRLAAGAAAAAAVMLFGATTAAITQLGGVDALMSRMGESTTSVVAAAAPEAPAPVLAPALAPVPGTPVGTEPDVRPGHSNDGRPGQGEPSASAAATLPGLVAKPSASGGSPSASGSSTLSGGTGTNAAPSDEGTDSSTSESTQSSGSEQSGTTRPRTPRPKPTAAPSPTASSPATPTAAPTTPVADPTTPLPDPPVIPSPTPTESTPPPPEPYDGTEPTPTPSAEPTESTPPADPAEEVTEEPAEPAAPFQTDIASTETAP